MFESGLVLWDVENVDKQDDGVARRIFHTNALKAMLNLEDPNKPSIQPGFKGVFAYLFILGTSLFLYKLYPHVNFNHHQDLVRGHPQLYVPLYIPYLLFIFYLHFTLLTYLFVTVWLPP